MDLLHIVIPAANITNTTTTGHNGPVYLGFISIIVAVIFFGTAFIPLKKYEASDGLFYQWVLSNGILLVGIVINIVRGSPQFYPIVMLGGAVWALGNVCVVTIVKTIGMGTGFCIWNVANIVAGWACGRFGLFGTISRRPSNEPMNYAGMALAAFSAIVYMGIRPPQPEQEITVIPDDESAPLLDNPYNNAQEQPYGINQSLSETHAHGVISPRPLQRNSITADRGEHHTLFFERLSPLPKRLLGIFLSIASGLCYGFSFSPSIHVQDNYSGASQNGLDYVFAQFIGIYVMCLFMFFVYAVFSHNRPMVNNEIILASLIGGVMWGIACSAWFLANQILSETISFPIVCSGPSIVCNLFTAFVFKEITQRRDLLVLFFGFTLTITACILTGLSV